MRIGLDALAIQSPAHGRRGIGRYAQQLIEALGQAPRGHELFLYAWPDLPPESLPAKWETRWLEPTSGTSMSRSRVEHMLETNPDRLDFWMTLGPFDFCMGGSVPAPSVRGPKLAALVHELIPLKFQDPALSGRPSGAYVRAVERIRRYDLLLAVADWTRRDLIEVLKVPPARVRTIGGAAHPTLFAPRTADECGPLDRAALRRLGIVRSFVLAVAGDDPLENLEGILEAFARLPTATRKAHQLVLTSAVSFMLETRLRGLARRLGVGREMVVTGHVSDKDLARLYQRCAAFLFPSLSEGLGLPILEAMQSGAVVVAGDNSSQPEIAGDAALLANASDPRDVAEKLDRVLTDRDLSAELRRRSLERARQFSWSRTADAALRAIENAAPARNHRTGCHGFGCEPVAPSLAEHGSETTRGTPGESAGPRRVPTTLPKFHHVRPWRSRKPRIAFFSPMLPARTGVADYAKNLIASLINIYDIDIFYDRRYVPHATWDDLPGLTCRSARFFEPSRACRNYHGVVYQMGNSPFHGYLYPVLLECPGVTVLHDLRLLNFHYWYGSTIGRQRDFFTDEVRYDSPEATSELLARSDRSAADPWNYLEALAEAGADCNRRIIERSRGVIVHSQWCRDRIIGRMPEAAERTVVVPLGAASHSVNDDDRRRTRERFGIDSNALVCAAFGFVHPDKMVGEIITAFDHLADDHPEAVLLFVGQETDAGDSRERAAVARNAKRARFLGWRDPETYLDLIAITDIGLGLRRPPTHGETSAALLDLLRSGVPTIVTDVDTFGGFPDTVVRKVRWDQDGPRRLHEAIRELARCSGRRREIAKAAIMYIKSHHNWDVVATKYSKCIEKCRSCAVSSAA